MCSKFGTSGVGVEVAVIVGDGVKVGDNTGIGETVAEGSTVVGVAVEQAFKHNAAKKTAKI